MSVTVCPTDERFLSDCAELESPSSLRRDGIFHRVLLPELQRVAVTARTYGSSAPSLSRWHFQTLRPIVSSPGFQHEFFAFLAQVSFYIVGIWFRHFAETRLCALQLTIQTKCLSIVPALSQTIKSLFWP